MQEAFIHFVWKHQYFNKTDLATIDGITVNVLKPGIHNADSGPDFKQSRIVIDNLEWTGSVEIHHRSSDWITHSHVNDQAYDNVILHVVWQHDKIVCRTDGSIIPTIEIGDRVDLTLMRSYNVLMNSLEPVPCANQLDQMDDFVISSMIDRMTTERLDEKAEIVMAKQSESENDWEATAFQMIAKNFGFKTNADQFERLGQLVPYKILNKHGDHRLRLEALLFGQAGFLEPKSRDEYHEQLQEEHRYLRHKYNLLEPMSEFQWKFMRLRPANFPTLRIAQLTAVMQNTQGLFSRLKEVKNIKALQNLFQTPTSAYWHNHYRFGKISTVKVNTLGIASIQNIGINTVAPLLAAYGKSVDQQNYLDQASDLLQSLSAEKNKIIKVWQKSGIKPESAFDSQGLIQLYNDYCSKKRCLSCDIGCKVLNRN